MTRWIALLRGINVGGHNRIPMAELRTLCGDIGWQEIATYIQSGNILFGARASAPDTVVADVINCFRSDPRRR